MPRRSCSGMGLSPSTTCQLHVGRWGWGTLLAASLGFFCPRSSFHRLPAAGHQRGGSGFLGWPCLPFLEPALVLVPRRVTQSPESPPLPGGAWPSTCCPCRLWPGAILGLWAWSPVGLGLPRTEWARLPRPARRAPALVVIHKRCIYYFKSSTSAPAAGRSLPR